MSDIVAIIGSSRKAGNTEMLAGMLLARIAESGYSTKVIPLAGRQIAYCDACDSCRVTGRCRQEDDFLLIYPELVQAKGIVLASPVYAFGPTPQMLAFCTRAGRIAHVDVNPGGFHSSSEFRRRYPHPSSLARKVGAAFTVARRAGATTTLELMNNFFLRNQMFLVGSGYVNVAFGYDKGDAMKDREGLANLEMLAENFAWLMDRLSPSLPGPALPPGPGQMA